MSAGKLGWALLWLLTALVGGWFLANVLVLRFLGLHDAPLAWNTWWQYFQAMDLPRAAPFAARIKLSGVAGFGLPLLAWAGLLIPLFRTRPEPCMAMPAWPPCLRRHHHRCTGIELARARQ